MNEPTGLDYWTLAIALLGAVTGVAALVTQVWGLVLSGPRIKVSVASAFAPGQTGWLLSLDASNVGRLPVTILELGTTFRAGGEWKKAAVGMMPSGTAVGPDIPHRLADGEASTWVLDPITLAKATEDHGVTAVHGYVRLATGQTLRSRRKVDVSSLARM